MITRVGAAACISQSLTPDHAGAPAPAVAEIAAALELLALAEGELDGARRAALIAGARALLERMNGAKEATASWSISRLGPDPAVVNTAWPIRGGTLSPGKSS